MKGQLFFVLINLILDCWEEDEDEINLLMFVLEIIFYIIIEKVNGYYKSVQDCRCSLLVQCLV